MTREAVDRLRADRAHDIAVLEAELLALLKEYEEVIKPYYSRKEEFLQRWVATVGIEHKVQNPDDTKVYHVARPSGKYIPFPEYDIEKMLDKDAKELGFDVQRQPRTKDASA